MTFDLVLCAMLAAGWRCEVLFSDLTWRDCQADKAVIDQALLYPELENVICQPARRHHGNETQSFYGHLSPRPTSQA